MQLPRGVSSGLPGCPAPGIQPWGANYRVGCALRGRPVTFLDGDVLRAAIAEDLTTA